jgi:exodeoxyribonuclease V gamma subunit
VALLEVESVQAKYGINAQGFETLKEWLQESGARWGINAEHRAKQGLPAYSEFSWEFAWHRLMAGYAMNSFEQGGDLLAIDNMLIDPFDAIEGSNTALLNSFYAFWQCLIHYKNVLSQSYSLVDWSLHLQALVDDFYNDIGADSAALKMLRKECEALKSFEQEYTDKIDISVIRDWIKPLLNQASRGRNPWQEGIKFCSLMPMRAVPFKVVYLMGMNQADYPKQVDKPLFDLMRYDYRAGDRSRRVGDRWLFLEALLSARDAFFISYTGRDQRNNEERNPSVVVAELMDYLTNGYSTADNTSVIAQICTEHKLQPFNKDYFTANGHLFSYNPQAYAIASAVKNPNDQAANLTSYQKPDTFIQSVVDVELSSFIQFFIDPAKWFFKHQYATWLAIDNTKIDDDELFNLPLGLGDWQLRNAMREYVAANPECQEDCLTVLESVEQLWRAKGLWPLGLAGDALKEKALEKIKPDWLFALKRIHTPVSMQTIHHKIALEQGEIIIQGALHLRGTVHFLHSASASKSKTALELAIKTALLAQATNEVTEVKEITFDGKIKAGLRERTYNITQNPQHALFLQALAKLYVQYQHTGLPYEFDVANALVAGESIHHLWAGGYNDGGLQQNPETRFYYHSVHHLQSENFAQVATEMHKALSAWQNENPDASAKSQAKKSSKKTKEDNNVV